MADERRLIDANALLKKARRTYPPTMANPYGGDNVVSVEDIEKTPTVDAVEVVRCGECRFVDTDACPMSGTPGRVSASDFCSYGERRAEDGH